MDIGEGMQLQIAVTFLHYVVTKSFFIVKLIWSVHFFFYICAII